MDIKEIALKVGAQGLSIEGTAHKFCMLDFCSKEVLIEFAEAIISAYKAELLKEAGEPVYQVCKSDSVSLSAAWIDVTEHTYNDAGLYPEYGRRILYTSDQLAAAIIKATKPLEERRCEICGYAEHHREHTSCLRTQLAKAEQLLQVAQGRCDGLEEKLAKAEQRVPSGLICLNERLPNPEEHHRVLIYTEGADYSGHQFFDVAADWLNECFYENPEDQPDICRDATHWMPLPKAPNGASS